MEGSQRRKGYLERRGQFRNLMNKGRVEVKECMYQVGERDLTGWPATLKLECTRHPTAQVRCGVKKTVKPLNKEMTPE